MAECKKCVHEKVCKYTNEKISIGTTVGETIHECKDYTSTTDVVEVVRCKGCKHRELCYPEKAIGKEATPGYFCKHYKEYKRATDFCSLEERKKS